MWSFLTIWAISFGEHGNIGTEMGQFLDSKFSNFIFLEFPEFKTFEELHRWSLNNHEQFWARMSKSMISWEKDFTLTGKFFKNRQ